MDYHLDLSVFPSGFQENKMYHSHFFHFPDEFDVNTVVDFTNSGHVCALPGDDLKAK